MDKDTLKDCMYCANCCKCPENSIPEQTDIYELEIPGKPAEMKNCELDECDLKCTCEKDQMNDLV